MKILAVSEEDSNLMFQLIGIESYIIRSNTAEEFSREFNKILQIPDVGIILLNEKYLLRYQDYFRKIKNRKIPIIVEIPDLAGPFPEKYFEDFIIKYIGLPYTGGTS